MDQVHSVTSTFVCRGKTCIFPWGKADSQILINNQRLRIISSFNLKTKMWITLDSSLIVKMRQYCHLQAIRLYCYLPVKQNAMWWDSIVYLFILAQKLRKHFWMLKIRYTNNIKKCVKMVSLLLVHYNPPNRYLEFTVPSVLCCMCTDRGRNTLQR